MVIVRGALMSYAFRDKRTTAEQLYRLTQGGSYQRRFPESADEWKQEYDRRHRAYVGEPYDVGEIKELKLFRALDESGDVLAETRRLTLDYRYVCDVDSAALLGDGISLQGADEVDRAEGLAVWRRSRLQAHIERYAKILAVKGDLHLEAVMGADGRGRIVAYSPEHVEVSYDPETGTQISRAIVTIPYFDDREVDMAGNVSEEWQTAHIYRRVITADRIEVYRDGDHIAAESGPNTLGVPTLVHVPFIPYTDPAHGLNAAYRLDEALALIDSLLTQIAAIGARHGNPLLKSAGAKVDGGSDIFKLGRVVNGPSDWDMEYIEPGFGGLNSLLQTVEQHRATLRETLPEFLFTESGANSSGSALNFRASQFVQKMQPIRARFYDALATVTEYAIHLERGTQPSVEEEQITLRVEGGDILPANTTATLEQLRIVQDSLGGILPEDRIAALQRVGLIPKDADPAAYARALQGVADTQIGTEEPIGVTPLEGQASEGASGPPEEPEAATAPTDAAD